MHPIAEALDAAWVAAVAGIDHCRRSPAPTEAQLAAADRAWDAYKDAKYVYDEWRGMVYHAIQSSPRGRGKAYRALARECYPKGLTRKQRQRARKMRLDDSSW